MRLLLAASALALITACTSTAPVTETTETASSTTGTTETVPSAFDLAMKTVDELVAAGNEQAAILRLEQLIGMQEATDGEKATALFRMTELQYGDGNDVYGAIDTLSELIDTYPDSPFTAQATELRDTARGEATSLNFRLETDETLTPSQEFEILFRLGEHQEAADLMLERDLTPGNNYLLDLYQIGYLCDDVELAGPSYQVTEPDGTVRGLQFCEFGK